MEISRSYRDGDQSKKGEAQIFQLQQQVDELRRLLREQVARQHSLEDNWKQSEARIIQVREQSDKQAAELTQMVQVRLLEEHRMKQELSELQVRVSEPVKPLREVRSQIAELIETRRREGEQVGLDKMALEKLDMAIRDLQGQIGRLDGYIKDLREAVKITANAQEFYQRELERVVDMIHSSEQIVRRQGEEFREEIKRLREEVALFSNRITRVEDLQRLDAARLEELPPMFEVLHQEDERIQAQIVRVEKVLSERYEVYQTRLEEIRQQTESQFFNVNQLISGQAESDAVRFNQLDDRIRISDAALLELQMRIEQVKQVEDTEIYDVYQLLMGLMDRQLEGAQALHDLARQHRAKSKAATLNQRRGGRNVRPLRKDDEDNQPDPDNSLI
jgi:chromosome segregation ATPase